MMIANVSSPPGSPATPTGGSLSPTAGSNSENVALGAQPSMQPGAAGHSATAVKRATEAANTFMESASSQIRFNVSDEAGETVVKMIDVQTKQVLLQIPNEQMIKIAQDPARLQGLAVDQQA
ncbi:MAG: flagellar protein FlaG [Thiobacillaceae bacterium]